ncbi:siderophore ABC transporter substrate-binding protein [Microbacterium rhizophilus]|uniref:siderophore ABC transporter substrate-binding protein n=1 Tax=Microbacterium rhizophilus TaxID=3138934 RepID=UPI0031E64BEE
MSDIRRTAARPIAALGLLTASAIALAACASTPAASDAPTEAPADETLTYTWDRNTATEEGAEPVFEETTVEVPADPQKIVVFDMAALDTIGALGGEIAGAPLESVPDYLEGYLADDAFNAGTLFEADLIEIEAQQPDLIVIGGRSSGMWEDLNEIAPTIDLSMRGGFLATLEENTTFLGEVLGAQDEAAAAIESLEGGIDDARAAVAEAGGSGLGIMVSGGELSALAPAPKDAQTPAVRGGLLYDVFGVEPVVEDVQAATHGEPISFEFLLEHDPEWLWVVDRDAAIATEGAQAAEVVLDNEIVNQTTAAQEDDILYLDPTAWYIVFGGIDTTQRMIDDVLQIAGR